MLSWIREKFGTVVIGGIIGFIAFVFVFYGVFNPKATRGLHQGAVAGTVNGDPISISEFQRALNQRLEFFKNLSGGNTITEEQMKAFRIRESVFEGLVRRKLLVQEADRQGLVPSDEEVRQRIEEIPAFQKNGKFDLLTYKQTLDANRYTPSSFERMMREDLSAQVWDEYFKRRVNVSETEIRNQFELANTKKNIKYVLLTSESGRKGLQIPADEVSKYLADPGKLNIVKGQYDRRKDTEYKGKTFDAVKESIAKDMLASEKVDQIRKINEQLADEVTGLMKADKSSDSKVNAILKPYGVEVKSTGLVSELTNSIPGVSDSADLLKDAFAPKSPIDPAEGGKAKKYSFGPWVLVAIVTESQKPDMTQLGTEHDKLAKDIAVRKERDLFEGWMQKVREKAKVDVNAAVVGGADA